MRNPKDILCSLYFFSKQSKERTSYSAVGPLGAIAGHLSPESFEAIDERDISLDEFIRKMVENPKLHRFWKLPSYIDDLDFVGKISNENIKEFENIYSQLQSNFTNNIEIANILINRLECE